MKDRKKNRRVVQGAGVAARKVTAYGKAGMVSKAETAYRTRYKVLAEKFGHEWSFKLGRKKLTNPQKAAISKKAASLVEFLNPENSFKFVRLTKAKKKKVKANCELYPEQFFGKGVFVPVPREGKKKASARFTSKGELVVTLGNKVSHFRLYKSVDIVRDPSIIERDAKELGAERAFVNIKGNRGGERTNGFSLKNFMRYMLETIIPDIESAWEDPDSVFERRSGKARKSAFISYFGVEHVGYDWNKHKRESQNAKRPMSTKRKRRK